MNSITTIDIWSVAYNNLCDFLEIIGKYEDKTLYRSIVTKKLYFLTDSRYGENFYL